MPGLHFFLTRFAPKCLRSVAFDTKYRRGDWDFAKEGPDPVGDFVRRFANHGDVLLMGCGSAFVLRDLNPREFTSVLGIDLSAEAIRRARRYAAPNVAFQQGDMATFRCPKTYDAILFSESFYYVPPLRRRPLLQRLCDSLKSRGCILITIAQPDRYRKTLSMIRRHFAILEDKQLESSDRRLLAIRAKA
jgi:trans-aconitate methyltransferase